MGFCPIRRALGPIYIKTDKKALTMDTFRWIPNSTLGEVYLMTDLREIEALTYGLLNNKDSPMIVTLEETVTRPILLFAAHVIIPMSLNSVLGMISVSFWIMNLSDGVICFPCLSQEMVGSGIDDAGHVISRRAPRSKVTRVPIWMDTGCRFKVCSTEFDAPSIFGNVASTK